MALWSPPPNIEENEIVGRQIRRPRGNADFDKINDVRHKDFVDNRLCGNLSFDRLGKGNSSKRVKKFITRLADEDVEKLEGDYVFVGWCSALCRNWHFRHAGDRLRSMPTRHEDGSVRNAYHAEYARDGFREPAQAYVLSTQLYHLAIQHGRVEKPVR